MTDFNATFEVVEDTSASLDQFSISTSESELRAEEEEAIEWSTYASIVYFTLNVLLIIGLAVFVYKKEGNGIKETLLTTWKQKGIYGQVLVHLYDTATDVGILVEWGILAYDGNNYQAIDMRVMFYTSLGFLMFYRLISVILVVRSWYVNDRIRKSMYKTFLCRQILIAISDMYIIRIVWRQIIRGYDEPGPRQKFVQLLEAVFESLPQVNCSFILWCALVRCQDIY